MVRNGVQILRLSIGLAGLFFMQAGANAQQLDEVVRQLRDAAPLPAANPAGRSILLNDAQSGAAPLFSDQPKPQPQPQPAPASAPTAQPAQFPAIRFAHDSAVLLAEAGAILDTIATAMNTPDLAEMQFAIIGHTSSPGSDSYNLTLSRMRAEAVVAALATRGVKRERLTAEGRGETEPVTGLDPADAGNRRVEMWRRND
jgi:outer membrane protein OmpA-like peptidoglycan-associated protein